MSIPVDQGDTCIFQFKTAPFREGEGQSSLECVHQALTSPNPQDYMVPTQYSIDIVFILVTCSLVAEESWNIR